uniref:Uncharacterized protein n=1 Tax=Oryza sativa subsp. japonica TaxID=39947 RepID=Q6Z449_ORYSJ|nr:hypothetical protein [Oryza sativa Japonica Group]
MATSPSDDDDRNGGEARLERRRRRRSEVHGARALPTARVTADRGELGGPFKGARARRRKPTATGIGRKDWGNTNPNQTRIRLFPKEISRRFQKRKGRGDPGDHFPSKDFTGEGKARPNLEGDGSAARLGFGRRRRSEEDEPDRWDPPVSGRERGGRGAADWADWAGEERGRRKERLGLTFGPKPKGGF